MDMVNQLGQPVNANKFHGWEVTLVYAMDDLDPRGYETCMYVIAKRPEEAANLAHKYFVKWFRPEEFGPRFPDVNDIPTITCLDLSDIKHAWQEANQPRRCVSTLRLYFPRDCVI